MKKMVYFLVLCLCVSGIGVFAEADGIASRSEIRAYIDYTPIDSYLINGYTFVAVDDLSRYGFSSTFHITEKYYRLERNWLETPRYSKWQWEESIGEQKPGKIEESDIKVYLGELLVPSYCIDGRTHIMIDELSRYGSFHWDDRKKVVSVTIYQDELQRELENAENIIEIDYVTDEYGKSAETVQYTGQVNENGIPEGIGCVSFQDQDTKIKVVGYFSNGKPDGNIYKETWRSPSRSYTIRKSYFIGTVDGKQTAEREYVSHNGSTSLLRAPNFGVVVMPYYELRDGSGPETYLDRTIYESGCYYEDWSGLWDNGEYRSWGALGRTRAVIITEYDSKVAEEYKKKSESVSAVEHFYQYDDGTPTNEKCFYNSAVRTLSGSGAETVHNDPEDGGGQTPLLIEVLLNDETIKFDVNPMMEQGRVLVPVRAIAEKLGAEVLWDDTLQTARIKKGDKIVIMQIDNPVIQVDDEDIELDVPPRIIDGRTLVPVRAISEGLDAIVQWKDELKQVKIYTAL